MFKLITFTCRKSTCTNSCQYRVLSMEYTFVCKCRGLWGDIIYDSVKSDDDEVEEDNENDNADNNT